MKNKEELAEAYVRHIYKKARYDQMYSPEVLQSKIDFLAGFEAAINKWINIKDATPEEDVPVLCCIINRDIPEMSRYEVLRYYQYYWYGVGLDREEEVEEWQYIL